MLGKFENMEARIAYLESELEEKVSGMERLQRDYEGLQKKHDSLKIWLSLAEKGGSEDKTKEEIDRIVREIDNCLQLLSE